MAHSVAGLDELEGGDTKPWCMPALLEMFILLCGGHQHFVILDDREYAASALDDLQPAVATGNISGSAPL